MRNSFFGLNSASLAKAAAPLCGAALGLMLASCAALGIGPSGPPQQKGEPTLSKCLTGSTLEIVPAGPDKTYPSTSLYLRRC